ncbi:TonB-dependent vitamin B12 receptor BtuB [Proteus mirabilis]|uniref:TonB-dependent vitamin B12 receptor BtuB n=1 Tax=Proteus mirabilis TaxID=584 RepID=UPI0021822320|nr:TonB-dependent vitamin B12 receptor BtuB [Proteus mirabilis]MCT0124306.1 TonB-dependent vitamin B12 receptor BtuB [Proteus mirabilis]MDF7337773.1 TonB-dependent vitamin B12 receptor BtuB [Proteus mirabilis]
MNNKKVFFLSSVALSVMTSSFNLFAQADNTLSVTANRFQQPTSSILAPMTIVDREQIDRWQSNSVLDVLRRMPGIDVAQSGGIGQMSSVFVRGTDSRHVLILIDGVRTNQAGISGSYDMSQLPLSLVQRIEYIRGPRSAVYGSDAIGGVINFITKRPNDGLTLNAGIGSHGYQNYNGSIQQKVGERTTLSAAGGYTYTKGIHATDDSVPVAAPFHDRHGFMNKSYWFGIDHIFNDNFQGYMKGYGYDNRTTYVASYPGNTDQSKTYNRNYEAGIKFSGDSYFSQLITVYSQTKDYNYISTNGRDGKGSSVDNSKQYNVQWGNTFLIPSGMISAGMDWQRQTIEANSASVPHQRTIDNTGLYLTSQKQLSSVIVEGAIRSDHHDEFNWHTTWQTSASWEFVDNYRVIASYGTAFKAPTLGQLYANNPAWNTKGNPNLKPEKSKQWEVGVEGLTQGIDWRLSLYQNDIDNLIAFRDNTYINYNKAKIKGAEWVGEMDTGLLHHQLTLQYLDARDSDNKLLSRRAKQQLKYQVDWNIADIDIGINYQYIGKRYDTDFNQYPTKRIKLGGVSLWDLTASYPITSHLSIRGRIANLFDKDYETAYGYRTPGREYFLTGSYNF